MVALLPAESTKRPSMLPSLSKLRGELVNHWANIQMRWLQLWEVECQLAARVIPLSGLSLLVLPLPWTLPRLMSLSATTSLAVINGKCEVPTATIEHSTFIWLWALAAV